MSRSSLRSTSMFIAAISLISIGIANSRSSTVNADSLPHNSTVQNAVSKVQQGEQIFRFDTFGDEQFWGDTIKLHQAIEGAALGGVGPGVSPKTALAVGLKVDIDALPANLVQQVLKGRVNLNDPAASAIDWTAGRTAISPSWSAYTVATSGTIANFFGTGNHLISKVRVLSPKCARDAIDLVAASVNILVGFIENDILGGEPGAARRRSHGKIVLRVA